MPISDLIDQLDTGDRRALIRAGQLADPGGRAAIARRVFSQNDTCKLPESATLLVHAPEQPLGAWEEVARAAMRALGALRPEEVGHLWKAIASVSARSPESRPISIDVVSRFVALATVGDAKLATELALTVLDANLQLPTWADPLVTWFLEHGGTEVRRTEEPRVALTLLKLIDAAAKRTPEHLSSLLRIAVLSESPHNLLTVDGVGDEVLWPAFERALERDLSEDIAIAFLHGSLPAIRPLGAARFLLALDQSNGLPRLREAMLRAFSTTQHAGPLEECAWQTILQHPPSGTRHPMTQAALHVALTVLARRQHNPLGEGAAWAEALAYAWFERFGLDRDALGPSLGGARLDLLAGDAELAPAIGRALERTLSSGEAEAHSTARRCLAAAASDPRLVSVALLALDATGGNPRSTHGLAIDDIARSLEAILLCEPGRAYSHGKSHVELSDDLDPELAVDLRDEAIQTGPRSVYLDMCAAAGSRADAISFCQLYFAHELVHVRQGVQRKSIVTQLRTAASESLLLQLDLAADDIAARIVESVPGSHTLLDLKALQLLGAEAFPARAHHTKDASFRKSRRIVSQMMELELRLRGAFGKAADASGFAMVEMSGAEGPLLLVWVDGQHSVLASAQLARHEAHALAGAALDSADLNAVKRLVAAVVARASPV